MSKLKTKNNEIELLNTEMKTAYLIIQLLQQRIKELEKENIRKFIHHYTSTHTAISSTCLLLGDTNTRRVVPSDLGDNCVVKTVSLVNIDILRSWVNEKLFSVPSEFVLLGGVHDILEESPPDMILHT